MIKPNFIIKQEYIDFLRERNYPFISNLDELLQGSVKDFLDALDKPLMWELLEDEDHPNDYAYMLEEIIDYVDAVNP